MSECPSFSLSQRCYKWSYRLTLCCTQGSDDNSKAVFFFLSSLLLPVSQSSLYITPRFHREYQGLSISPSMVRPFCVVGFHLVSISFQLNFVMNLLRRSSYYRCRKGPLSSTKTRASHLISSVCCLHSFASSLTIVSHRIDQHSGTVSRSQPCTSVTNGTKNKR